MGNRILSQRHDFEKIILNQLPLIDVRAPVEFEQGAFPNSINMPILNDDERRKVGTCYKQQGPEQATALGHKLVSGEIKSERVSSWLAQIKSHPSTVVYCFRGGQRSQLTQQWIKDAGINVEIVKGGYKAIRTFMLSVLDDAAQQPKIMLGGMTGTGKTRVINAVSRAVDLEGYANHRGSSFGRQVTVQPSQISFENALAADVLSKQQQALPVCYEDEGRMIGSLHLPLALHASFANAPMVFLEANMQERVDILRQEYIDDMLVAFTAQYNGDCERGFAALDDYLQTALQAITRRLGNARYQDVSRKQQSALAEQKQTGSSHGHDVWLASLLTDYYDPMYRYQLNKKQSRIVFSGDQAAVTEWLAEYCSKPSI